MLEQRNWCGKMVSHKLIGVEPLEVVRNLMTNTRTTPAVAALAPDLGSTWRPAVLPVGSSHVILS